MTTTPGTDADSNRFGTLTINRIVHYTSHGTPPRPDGTQAYPARCRPAIVTDVGAWLEHHQDGEYESSVDGARMRDVVQRFEPSAAALMITNPTGLFFATCRQDQDGRAGGTWHWPTPECQNS